MIEEFIDIKGYEGIYQVSNLGRVKSLSRKYVKIDTILKGIDNGKGYLKICLHKEGTQESKYIHQLVAVGFLNHKTNGYKGLIVDHIDNNKLNNNVNNLQSITSRENNSKDVRNKSSTYTGVTYHIRNHKWVSRIKINGKQKNLGSFHTQLEASNAYQKALHSL